MNTMTLRWALLPGAAALLALALSAGCGTDNGDEDTTPPAAAGGEAEFTEADVAFAQNMIVHHQQALEMAELAETRAENPELAQLASEVATAQEPEITTMTDWLTAWGEPVEPPAGHEGMAMPGMASEDEMAALAAADGVDFDRMFTRMLIAHHDGAVQMARDVQAEGVNDDVNALAATIEQDQSAEVETLEGILDRL
ncbi:MAG: DUF305 domain-containing protein [Micromonosporaceae bacterium]|nr:DUF305 domain-containing protein [Micromonosporaceae bacterium]